MDNLGTEVGQKMRSAVKAKLIELGTGGSAGYIDDELPDYVMIMVANKRSKQQMIGDLNLFLGSHTELFVTWLHEVLQKLQEVTLPAAVVQKVKRKSSELENTATATATSASKKEKKEKKKEKKIKRSTSEKTAEEPPSTSISDVFADHLLQKAKKTMEAEASVQIKGKKENSRDDFDIPTITEIAERNENEVPNKKELAELEDLQKKIDQAKRQLKSIESDESEDEDFLNIKEDAEEELEDVVADKANRKNKVKSPIVFESSENNVIEEDDNEELQENSPDSDQERSNNRRVPITYTNNSNRNNRVESIRPKRPVHERLGLKSPQSKENVISLSTHRRSEKELYVPTFRRNEVDRDRERQRERERDRELVREREIARDREMVRERDREREQRERERDRERDRENEKDRSRVRSREREDRVNIRQRIGSRVIVAPPKPEFEEEEPEDHDRPVNSMIKIKPRPPVSPSKQASKNLLLRAVAEAQKSTALIKPKRENARAASPSSNSTSRSQKLYSKSYRDRNREAILKRAAKDNIVIEVNAEKQPSSRLQRNEDEYIPEPISDRGDSDNDFIYVPQAINSANSDEEYGSLEQDESNHRNRTQFVVTLDDKSRDKFITKHKIRVVEKNVNGIEIKRLEINNEVTSSTRQSSVAVPLPASASLKRETVHIHTKSSAKQQNEAYHNYKKPKEVKKLIIKNDTEDEDSTSPTKESRRKHSLSEERSTTPPLPKPPAPKLPLKRKRSTVSPIKFDLDEQQLKRRSKSGERDDEDKNSHEEDALQKVSTKKTEKKYDNIPEFLSSVPVEPSTVAVKSKPKERCKYFPTCGKGDTCEFLHPSMPCKAFPNCKFAEKCLFLHPKCKYDMTCQRIGCNNQHSVPVTPSAAPQLSSHVVPVQNYKSIIATPLPAICKYYPKCTNSICNFYHPKLCRFGRNCINKVECGFYHHDLPVKDKFKWVASLG